MALVRVQNPTFAGTTEAGTMRKEGYLPGVAFNKPVWDDMLFQQANKWWLNFYLEKYAGEDEPIAANEVNWAEDGKWYEKQTIASIVSGTGTATMVIRLSQTVQYFIPGDIVDLGVKYPGSTVLNLYGRVTAVGTNSGTQTITVSLIDPGTQAGNLDADDFPVGNQVSLIYNSQTENWQMPAGRIHAPEQFSNKLTKIANSWEATDDAANRMIWFKNTVNGQFYWVPEEEQGCQTLHAMHVDMSLLLGQGHSLTDGTWTGVGGDGLLTYLNRGSLIRSFAGAISEDDIQEFITDLKIYSKYKRHKLIVGTHLHRDILKALMPYFKNASIWYGPATEGGNKVGVNIREFYFGDHTLELMEYQGFSDPDFLPQNANSVNYNMLGMALNLEADGLRVVYKKRAAGGKMKNWLNYQFGPTFAESGQPVDRDRASMKGTYFTHIGLKCKGLQSHGLLVGS